MKRRNAAGSLVVPTKASATRPARKPREKLLIVAHSDGWIEVFGPDHIDVRIVQRLHIDHENADTATMLDELVELSTPRSYWGLHMPRNIRATGLIERRTPADEVRREVEMEWLRACQGVANDG